jgi:two-component system, cell cycle response regulator DivK
MTRRKILVVEDNEQNLYLITFLLQNQGYEVVLAHSGLQAIEQAKIERPDLILLDIQLPEMDGYEATRKIRDIPEISHTPIVAVTSYAMVDDRTKALAAGCNGYMEKPIQPEIFVAEIGKYVGTVGR